MNGWKRKALLGVLLAVMASPALPARAQDWRFHGRDIRRFRHHDYDAWRHGRWHHGRHGGRYGWWWNGGGLWYLYPAPVYPYPNPYIPPVVVQPPPVTVQPAPPGPPPASSWYYCDNPPGYYPYVPECRDRWRQVPATPQQ